MASVRKPAHTSLTEYNAFCRLAAGDIDTIVLQNRKAPPGFCRILQAPSNIFGIKRGLGSGRSLPPNPPFPDYFCESMEP